MNIVYITEMVILVAVLSLVLQNKMFQKKLRTLLWRLRYVGAVLGFLFFAAVSMVGLQPVLAFFPTFLTMVLQLGFGVLFMFVQFAAMMYFMSRPRMYKLMPGQFKDLSFADYVGNDKVKEAAKQVLYQIKHAKQIVARGAKPTYGVLLEGDPGSGKSYLSQIIASEGQVPFYYCSAASLQSAFMGMGAMTIWRLYSGARKLANQYGACVIFLDEIDAIGQSRTRQGPLAGGMGMGGMMMGGAGGILNELLNQMQPINETGGFFHRLLVDWGLRPYQKSERPTVLTIGATNVISTLDPALLRSGRFDLKITVTKPGAKGRRDLLEYYLGKVVGVDPNLDIDRMVQDTMGYSPADIAHIINQSVHKSIFANRDLVTYEDFTAARQEHELGLPTPITLSDRDRRHVAYHEAGHAVVNVLLRKYLATARVTIVPRRGHLGVVQSKPREESYTRTESEFLEDIRVSLASRAVEEIMLGIKMSGFSGDLSQATNSSLQMIGTYGMGEIVWAYTALGEGGIGQAQLEAQRLVNRELHVIKEFIRRNQKAVTAVAESLLELEELDGRVVEELVLDKAEFRLEEGEDLLVKLADAVAEFDSRWEQILAKRSSHAAHNSPIVVNQVKTEDAGASENRALFFMDWHRHSLMLEDDYIQRLTQAAS